MAQPLEWWQDAAKRRTQAETAVETGNRLLQTIREAAEPIKDILSALNKIKPRVKWENSKWIVPGDVLGSLSCDEQLAAEHHLVKYVPIKFNASDYSDEEDAWTEAARIQHEGPDYIYELIQPFEDERITTVLAQIEVYIKFTKNWRKKVPIGRIRDNVQAKLDAYFEEASAALQDPLNVNAVHQYPIPPQLHWTPSWPQYAYTISGHLQSHYNHASKLPELGCQVHFPDALDCKTLCRVQRLYVDVPNVKSTLEDMSAPDYVMSAKELQAALIYLVPPRQHSNVITGSPICNALDHLADIHDPQDIRKALNIQILCKALVSGSHAIARWYAKAMLATDEDTADYWTYFEGNRPKMDKRSLAKDPYLRHLCTAIKSYAGTEAKFKTLFKQSIKADQRKRVAQHAVWEGDSLAAWDTIIGKDVQEIKCLCCDKTLLFRTGPDGKAHAGWHRCHIVPHAKGGEMTLANLMVACSDCNRVHKTRNVLNVMHENPDWRPQLVPFLQRMARILDWIGSLEALVHKHYSPDTAPVDESVLILVRSGDGQASIIAQLQAEIISLKRRVCALEDDTRKHEGQTLTHQKLATTVNPVVIYLSKRVYGDDNYHLSKEMNAMTPPEKMDVCSCNNLLNNLTVYCAAKGIKLGFRYNVIKMNSALRAAGLEVIQIRLGEKTFKGLSYTREQLRQLLKAPEHYTMCTDEVKNDIPAELETTLQIPCKRRLTTTDEPPAKRIIGRTISIDETMGDMF